MLFQAARPKAAPDPYVFKPDAATMTGAFTFKMEPTWMIRIHSVSSDAVAMDFSSPEGKTLEIRKDGTVKGDLPMTDAAKAFWSELGKAYPSMCEPQKASVRP